VDWLDHPRFRRTRERALDRLKRDVYRFRRLPPVAFLCGGENSLRRDRLATYLREHHSVLVFYAEAVWLAIAEHHPTANALEMEAQLARLSDIVIVVVESPGTFAELGAFALSEPLRAKLLPILSKEHKGKKSFIETGPVRWIDTQSYFQPSIWTDLEAILGAADQIAERISRIPKAAPSEITDLAQSQKHLVFFLADIVAVFGPCNKSQVDRLLEGALGKSLAHDTALLLGLGVQMGMLRILVNDGVSFYYRPLGGGRLSAFHHTKRYADVGSMRAETLGAMLTTTDGRAILGALEHVVNAT
jgi:hypothetical protein